MAEGLKLCSRCKVEHSTGEFNINRQKKDGLHSFCKKQQAAKIKAERDADPERFIAYSFKSRLKAFYGITVERYYEMLEAQGGACAICQITEPGGPYRKWHVDHDHNCCPGEKSCGTCVRGLLCVKCNTGIGMLGDSVATIARALEYLT